MPGARGGIVLHLVGADLLLGALLGGGDHGPDSQQEVEEECKSEEGFFIRTILSFELRELR